MAASWYWPGALTSDGFKVNAKVGASLSCRLAYQAGATLDAPSYTSAVISDATTLIVKFDVTGLTPDADYTYAVEIDGVLDPLVGHIHTAAVPGEPMSFRLAHGTCKASASNHLVFDSIAAKAPVVFIENGDLHYADSNTSTEATRRGHYDTVLGASRVNALWRSCAVAYTWDDHDFCGGNSNGTASNKATAQAVYRQVVPTPTLPATDSINHSFILGRIGVVVTDLRSFRSPNGNADDAAKTMMGATQKAWFKDTLLDLRDTGAVLILWASSSVWNGYGTTSSGGWYDNDQWSAFNTERRELADWMVDNDLGHMVWVLTGDAHAMAYDDGAHGDFSTTGDAPVRQFMASALDESSIVRGNNHTGGIFGGGGQYGLFDFTDNGNFIEWTWKGIKVNATTGVDDALIEVGGLYKVPA